MDILRRDNGIDDDLGDAPGIEPPPMIGQDERRMHVRAYNFWAKLLEGRSFPAIESLEFDEMGDFGEHAVLLDFTSGIENPAITYIGEKLAAECDMPVDVQYIDDVPRRSLLSRLTDHYLQIIANRAPIGFEAEFVNSRNMTIMYRGVLLPFSSDDDTIDFILGVINWKEAADTVLTGQIAAELAAAPPPPVMRPTVPVWADGPDASDIDDLDEEDEDGEDSFIASEDEPLLLDTPMLAPLTPIAASADTATDFDDEATLIDAPAAFDANDASLADWLASARECADIAEQNNARSRTALYQAIGRAHGFAAAAAAAPEDYAELLEEAGITPSARAPMTPVVKLVFGARHDKTRLAEYAAVLTHAEREGIAPDALPAYIASHDGGIKGLVKAIRAANRPERSAQDGVADLAAALFALPALAPVTLPEGYDAADYAVLLVRREADGSHVIVGVSHDDEISARRLAKAATGK